MPDEYRSRMVREVSVPMFLIDAEAGGSTASARNTVGGWPFLPAGHSWPRCYCGEGMMLFFQFDLPEGIPGFAGYHLLVFQCPSHNDAVCQARFNAQLPERYWEKPRISGHPGAFWRILVHRHDTAPTPPVNPYLRSRDLVIRPGQEALTIWRPDEVLVDGQATEEEFLRYGSGRFEFKIGGVPSWTEDHEPHRCCCGANLAYLCELPADRGFAKELDQPPQIDTFDNDLYVLFLGNEFSIVACAAHCDPAAAWPLHRY